MMNVKMQREIDDIRELNGLKMNVPSAWELKYENLKNNGIKEKCEKQFNDNDSMEDSVILKPYWFDQEKFNLGKRFAKKYFFSLMFAHLSGLILLVYIKSILTVLLSTGNSRTVSHLFHRYFRTLIHVKTWYESDVWNEHDQACKSIKQVRSNQFKIL